MLVTCHVDVSLSQRMREIPVTVSANGKPILHFREVTFDE